MFPFQRKLISNNCTTLLGKGDGFKLLQFLLAGNELLQKFGIFRHMSYSFNQRYIDMQFPKHLQELYKLLIMLLLSKSLRK